MAAVDADAQAQRQRGRRPMKVLMVANPDEGALVGYATPRRSTARASPPKRSDTPTSFVSISGSGARSSNSPAPDNYPEAERIIVAVTHDAENYVSVDLTGHTEAQAIRKCILSKLPISNDPCSTVFIYRIEIDGVAIGSALDDTELMIDCQCYGDDKGSLKFLVLCSDNPDPPEPASTIAPIQPTLPSSSSLSPPSYSRPRSAPPDNVRPGNEYSVAPVPTVSEPRFADAETTWSQNQSLHRRPLLHDNQHPGLSWGIQGTPSPPTRRQNLFVRRLPRPPPRQQYPIQQEPRALLPSTTHPLPPDSEYEDLSTSKRQTSASSSHRQSTAPMARIDHIRGDSTTPSRPTAWSTRDLPDRPYHSFDGSRSALQRPVADPGGGNNRHSLPSRPLPRTPQHSTPPPIDTHSHDPYSHQSPDDQVHDIYDGMEDPTRTLRPYKARPRSASPSYVAGNATLGTPKPEHASLDGSRTALPSLSDASTVGSHMLDVNDHDLIIAISDVSDSPGTGDDVDPPVPAPGPRLVSQSMTPPPVARYVSPTPETISCDLVAQETQLYGDDSEGGGTSWQMPGQDSAPPTSSVDIGTPFISQTATPPSGLQLRIDRTSLRSGANSPALTQTTLAPVLPLAVRKKTALGAEKRSDGELTPTLLANHQSSRTFSKCETHPQAGEAPEKLDRNTSNFKSGRSIVETTSVSDCTSSVAKSPLTGSANGIVTNVKMGNPASDAQSTVKIQSGQISCEEMFRYLVDHGCKDLSSDMDPGGYSSGLVQGGAFGDIWKGKLHDETELAIKVWRFSSVSQEDAKPMKRAMREIYHWSKAKHENIQELMGVIMFQGRLGMVSLWMKHGNLRDFVRKNPNTDRLSWCVQVAAGLSYLHDQNMVHGDLKAANILVSEDCAAKICDFDHSILSECTLVFSDTTNAGGGTLRWMAPELLLSSEEGGGPPARRSKQSDVYALGMTLLRMASEKAQEIVTGQVPYSDYRYDQGILRALDRRQHPARPAALQGPEGWRPKMWMMLLECWDHDPTVRPPASQVHERLESTKNQA